MHLWTEDLLPKHGAHVKSLSLIISKNCSGPDDFVEHDPFYDNLSPEFAHDQIEFLSPNNVRGLIRQCPNLSALKIGYGFTEEPQYASGTEAFLLDLFSILKNPRQLRCLELGGQYSMQFATQFSRNIVTSLPFLESLAMDGFTASRDERKLGDGSFGSNLSELKFLSQLHLSGIVDIGVDWCLYDWSKRITDLSIRNCGNLSPSSAHQIVQYLAPNLKKLKLEFSYKPHDATWEIDPNWTSENCFCLPYLTELELSPRNALFLESFKDCKSLRYLKWTYRTPTHCKMLNKMLLKATWPDLNKLVVVPYWCLEPTALDPPLWIIKEQLLLLEEYGKQASMNVTIGWPSAR